MLSNNNCMIEYFDNQNNCSYLSNKYWSHCEGTYNIILLDSFELKK